MRSSMTRGIKANLSSMYRDNLSCPLLCGSPDQQSHLMQCHVLLARLTVAEEETTKSASYTDIFGSVEAQLNVIMILSRLLEIRQGLLDNNNDSLPVKLITALDPIVLL